MVTYIILFCQVEEHMLENLQTVAGQVFILFILISVGFACTKLKVIKEDFIKGLTGFVIAIVTPCNIISSFQRQFEPTLLQGLLYSAAFAVLLNIANIFVAKICIRTKDQSQSPVIRFAAAFSNCGYMALPLQKALLGDIGVFYGSVYVAIFQMFVWSYGVVSLSGDRKNISFKKIILSPPIFAVIIGMILFVTSTTLPRGIASPIESLAAMNTPLPMIIIGYYLANTDFKKVLKNVWIYLGTFLRLVIGPCIALGITMIFHASGEIMLACVIAASAPSAAITTMISAMYGKDTSASVGMISLTTICSIITMPVIIAIAQMLA